MKALILAAGYATRLYPLTIDRPKALLPIAGKAMLDYLVDEICTLPGLDEIHLVSNHRFIRPFEEWAEGARARHPAHRFVLWDDLTTSDADKKGAIGDIQFVLEQAQLDDDLLVAASDNFFTFPLMRFYEAFCVNHCDTLLTARFADHELLKRFAVATVDEHLRVLHLEEKPQEPKSDLGVYALYFYRRETLPLFAQYLAEGNSPDAPGHFPVWLHTRREVRVYPFEGECIDIGTPQSYREVCARFSGQNS